MQTSENTEAISAALIEFHGKVATVRKQSNNPFFKSTYASLHDILSVVLEPLTKCGLAVVQSPTGEHGLSTRITHASGQWIEDTYTMDPGKNNPQGIGSAITYQRRYALVAMLCLDIDDDEDDDGNAASTPTAVKPSASVTPPKSNDVF